MLSLNFTRRTVALGAAGMAMAGGSPACATGPRKRAVSLVLAPSNLGLRPAEDGGQQGAWEAPEVLMAAGLEARLGAAGVTAFDRPAYRFDAQPGTRIRNGQTIRAFSLEVGAAVTREIGAGRFPLVVGGDCSVLLGALWGARTAGGRGLAHLDGHSDFFHPGNYNTVARLGAVAGMDLALATGRGEALLTAWPGIDGPLAADADTVQIGERDALDPDYDKFYGDVVRTGITRLIIQDVLRMGAEATARRVLERLAARGLDRAWLHIDLDVLDQAVMPAVDSPGSPGLDFTQFSALVGALVASGRFVGATVAIYDPRRDPDRRYAPLIVEALGQALEEVA